MISFNRERWKSARHDFAIVVLLSGS